MSNLRYNQQGMTIIEVLVALAIFSITMVGIYSLFNLATRVTSDTRARVDATAIANQRLEMVRNLRYDDVGTEGGVPSGTIPRTEEIVRNRISYTVTTDVMYIDDPFDGLAGEVPDDLFNSDYKRVRVEVAWPRALNDSPVIFISDIAPKGIESDITGGTLNLTVFDALGNIVPTADVHLENTDVVPVINLDTQTTVTGKLILPGMTPSVETYDIVVTKAGYSTDQTHETDPVNNPNPNPPPISIFDGIVTEHSFTIDQLSALTIQTRNLDESAIGNIDFSLRGSKTIGTDGAEQPIYKYQLAHATDATGVITLNDMEWDTYTLSIDGALSGYDIAGANLPLPINLLPGSNQTLDIYVAPHTDHSLLVTARGESGALIENASVHVTNAAPLYDATQTTTSYGQTFFSNLANSTYTVEVTAAGYEVYAQDIPIDGWTSAELFLTESP
ncbi:MAG: prepilin-type N-terminal cleavage/methylation domain-containing protein [bacterium]|nr:prepilin-type N-terminal cleavage/methylation domain-containing protein [bacterium]